MIPHPGDALASAVAALCVLLSCVVARALWHERRWVYWLWSALVAIFVFALSYWLATVWS